MEDLAQRSKVRRTTLWIVLAAVLIGGTYLGFRKFERYYDWEVIKNAVGMRGTEYATSVDIKYHPLTQYAVVRMEFPPGQASAFARANRCLESDRTEFVRPRAKVPRSFQSIPANGTRYHKAGETSSGKPFEILVHSDGVAVFWVMFDD